MDGLRSGQSNALVNWREVDLEAANYYRQMIILHTF
jgi:hypothetical protein